MGGSGREPQEARLFGLGNPHAALRQLVVPPSPTSAATAGDDPPTPDEPGGLEPAKRRVDRALGKPVPARRGALDPSDEVATIAGAVPQDEKERRAGRDHG